MRTTRETLFWGLKVYEVQDQAKTLIGRTLTPRELLKAENMFSDGIGSWSDVLDIAIKAAVRP